MAEKGGAVWPWLGLGPGGSRMEKGEAKCSRGADSLGGILLRAAAHTGNSRGLLSETLVWECNGEV